MPLKKGTKPGSKGFKENIKTEIGFTDAFAWKRF
jgi:hypothetical protein